MAMVAIRVPQETGHLLENMSNCIPGDSQTASDMHVTVAFLGDDVPISSLAAAMTACHAVTSRTSPFVLTVDSIESFEPGKDGTPIIMPVKSEELHALEQAVKAEMDRIGVFYDKKWPEFKPHVTLSYVKGMRGAGALPAPLSWGAFGLTVYGGNHGNEGVSIELPFELPSMQLKMNAIASRIAKK
jgi:2'-5' RNA ligase